ncbi:MAG TPA: branched-chain amino acid ABC transporter ATP-binding protein/permease [Alphaproteobacteria bacterium]|nr:branched-chain amino acid ABC transporter ATP-binding protein/permease [Alphaproteobacteria bacterium]
MNGMARRLARWSPEALVALALLTLPFLFDAGLGSVDLLTRILIWGLIGFGFDLLFGYTGLLSFGQAAFYGTGGFVTAYLLTANVIANVWLAILLGALAGVVYSLAIGYLALRRIGIYFAMITLAFGELSYFLENSPLAAWTGGENGLPGVPAPSLGGHEISGSWPLYALVAIFFFVGYAIARFIVLSPVGTVFTAIRDNAKRTEALGHNVQAYKLTAFALAAIYASVAGSLLGIFQSYMPPGAFGLDTSGQLVIQTVIGGAGTLLGPTVGAAIWLCLRDLFQQIPVVGDLWKFALGLTFVVLVTLLRKGVCGEILRWLPAAKRLAPTETPAIVAAAARAQAALDTGFAPAEDAIVARTDASPFALEAQGVSKFYGGIHAVESVSLAVPEGALHAIIGPNGAGKSTFLRLLAGEEAPSSGRIRLHGVDMTGAGAGKLCQAGLGKSYQINQLFLRLTVRENLRVGVLAKRQGRLKLDFFRAADSVAAVETQIAELLADLGLEGEADMPVATLAYGAKRRLEVGLALAARPTVLLLDEPLAGLSPSERRDMRELVRRLHERRTIVLVEHDMDAVFELAERITVLHDGRLLAEGSAAEVQADSRVQRAYLGGLRAP